MCVDVFSIEVVIAWRFCFALPPLSLSLSLSRLALRKLQLNVQPRKLVSRSFAIFLLGFPSASRHRARSVLEVPRLHHPSCCNRSGDGGREAD